MHCKHIATKKTFSTSTTSCHYSLYKTSIEIFSDVIKNEIVDFASAERQHFEFDLSYHIHSIPISNKF